MINKRYRVGIIPFELEQQLEIFQAGINSIEHWQNRRGFILEEFEVIGFPKIEMTSLNT